MHQQRYAHSLESQLTSSTESGRLDIGKSVSTTELDLLNDGQVGQLYQLREEILKHKPDSSGTAS